MADEAFVFPTSFAQERLWFLDQLVPNNAFYNIHTSLRLSFAVNRDVLEASLNEIVRRHETLRTTFQTVDGQPLQAVALALELRLAFVDLSGLPESKREAEAIRLATEEAQEPFDLASGPLLRATLLRLGEADYVFLLTMHHIIADGWSMAILFQELTEIYAAFRAGRPSPLPELPIQYADFAVWQKDWLRGAVLEEQLAYWREQLQEVPILQLPTDWPRPAVQSFAGGVCNFWLAEPLYLALVELSQKEAVTLFMTMVAAFLTLLYRYSAQEDLAIGTPVANRNRAEVEGLIGFFVNTLVLRTNLSGNPSFRELLARVREVALGAYAHQDLPFEKLVHELQPERDMGRNPLFQVNFQLFSDMGGAAEPGPFDGESLEIEKGTANFDLALDLWEYPDGLWGILEFSTDLFNEETIRRMAEHFRTLLTGIVADPDQRLSELPLLAKRERQMVLGAWNNTETQYPKDKCLHHLFEAQVERTPDAVALVFRQQALTYRELDRRANQLAHYLQSLGVRPETMVAICVERSLEMVIGLLGILKAGGAYLPVDPACPKERLAFMLHDAQAPLLLSQEKLLRNIPAAATHRVSLDTGWNVIAGLSHTNPVSDVTSDNLAYVIYTSGSTGKPKGVMIPHQAVCNHLLWMQAAFPLTEADRILQKYPFSFDASICEIFSPLLAGARVIMTEPAERWDIASFLQLLVEEQITVLDLVPSMLQVLLEDDRFRACRSLRRVTCGGEALSADIRNRLFAQLDVELNNIYGPTEATIGSTFWTCRREEAEQEVPIGRPIANTQVYLLDPYLNPVPVGIPGELYIGGDGLARGYLNRPDLTAEKFIRSPFSRSTGARLYKTGDLARYFPDGNLEYLGRVDQQVKVRGYRIELGEIESTLAEHPAVQSCAILAREDMPEQTRVVAYVVPVADKPELWPSLGEYAVYDELLYYAMTHDEGRNRSYRAAITSAVNGKIALDIGTGADAVLARFCVEAGAERVYAIEVNEDAYRRARELIERLGLTEKIVLIGGDSTQVQLPERVDVCVSEILGTIGSSEGVTSILADARRFLKDEGIMIPQRCVTRIAAISLPDELAVYPTLGELPRHYVEEVFKSVGYPFDLRMCIKSFPQANLLSVAQVFEDLNFNGSAEREYDSQITFTLNRKSRLDGFLLWLNLYVSEDEVIDSLNDRHNWLPVFFPAFSPGLEVSEGDVVEAVCSCRLSNGARMPDYTIRGTLTRSGAEPIVFGHSSPHRTTTFKGNPFYASLFTGIDGQPYLTPSTLQPLQGRNGDEPGRGESVPPTAGPPRGLVPTLRSFLQDRLPDYMVPSAFVVLDALPLTANGKVDRRALPAPGHARPELEAAYVAARNEAEGLLVTIWSELLGIERIGVHDNFFELGGDSILSIQIIARANQAGLRLRPAQLFQHQTIAELAAVADTTPIIQAEQGVVTGDVPLTPIQHWFFEQRLTDPHHYNQSVLLEVPPAADTAKLSEVLTRLITHHDALRLRFLPTPSGWQQSCGGVDESVPVSRFDLSSLSAAERIATMERAAAELQSGLNLSAGPLVRAALFDLGDLEPGRLLIVIHHLAIDGVSWRILLEDWWTTYQQLVDGEEIRLPHKTTSFQHWSQRLLQYAETRALREEAPYWFGVARTEVVRLPTDHAAGTNTVASQRTVGFSLSAEETRTLLQKVPKAYHTHINDALLTALVQAFTRWTGERSLMIDLEGHGREIIFEDVDLSRTVGWFTTIFPVWLDLGQASNVGDALKSIKEQLRRIPNRGIGYGVLRYLSGDEQIAGKLQEVPQPEVSFNYLGQFGQSLAESSLPDGTEEPTGSNLSPRGQRRYLLEIDAGVYEGRLHVDWAYSEAVHRRATIERLVEYFAAALRTLIAHCSSPGAGGYTPSDFSAARVSQDDLETLLAKIGASQPEVDHTDEL